MAWFGSLYGVALTVQCNRYSLCAALLQEEMQLNAASSTDKTEQGPLIPAVWGKSAIEAAPDRSFEEYLTQYSSLNQVHCQQIDLKANPALVCIHDLVANSLRSTVLASFITRNKMLVLHAAAYCNLDGALHCLTLHTPRICSCSLNQSIHYINCFGSSAAYKLKWAGRLLQDQNYELWAYRLLQLQGGSLLSILQALFPEGQPRPWKLPTLISSRQTVTTCCLASHGTSMLLQHPQRIPEAVHQGPASRQ